MRFRSRVWQVLCLAGLCALLMCALLHRSTKIKINDNHEDVAKWKERAPRSLPGDYEEEVEQTFNDLQSNFDPKTVVVTVKPMSTLNDIFISVKTTKNFHRNRLEIITKTWLHLAKEQVIS